MRTTMEIQNRTEPPIIIFDGMSLAHTAYHAYQKLSNKGKSVSMIFGIPVMIRAHIQNHAPEKVIVVWDGEQHPLRKELLPGYKSHREKDRDPIQREKFLKQIIKVRKVLYAMGIPQVHNPNIEGDDMIYLTVERYKKAYHDRMIRVVSGDNDMLQLIDKNVWVEGCRTDSPINTLALFKAHFSLEEPKQHIDYMIMVGDDSDDIPGYMGIGPAKAKQFLKKYGSISNFLANKRNHYPQIKRKVLRRLYERNNMLMNLKLFCFKQNYNSTDITYYKDSSTPLWDDESFLELCLKYNMKLFRTASFQKPFKDLP